MQTSPPVSVNLFGIPYRYFTGIVIPLGLTFMGIVGKKLTRKGVEGWIRNDLYLGPELTLAAVSAAALNVFDLLNPARSAVQDNHRILLTNIGVCGLGMILFFFVLSQHQDWESNKKRPQMELFWLAGVCNVIGFGLMVMGIILVPES